MLTTEEHNFNNKKWYSKWKYLFLEHKTFSREIKKFNKKYDAGIGYKNLKNLLQKHFHRTNQEITLTPTILRRIDNLGINLVVYKVTMRVKNLRSGQSPRVCFRVEGNLITFLCYGSHVDDYKNSRLRELIKKRINDIDSSIEFN